MEEIRHEFRLLQARFREYLTAQNRSQRTIEEYPANVERFLEYLDTLPVENIRSATIQHIQGYHGLLMQRRWHGKPITSRTVNKRLSELKTFFRFLHKTGKIYHDPSANLDLPRRGKQLPRNILEPKEIEALLERPELNTPLGIRDRAIMELLYSCGLRNSELRQLEVEHLELDERIVFVKGKGDRDALVPFGKKAAKAIQHYLLFARYKLIGNYRGARPLSAKRQREEAGREYLFLSKNGNKITVQNIGDMIKRYTKTCPGLRAGIKKKITPHSLRHTCATHLLRNGADIRQIQALLRHKDINSTQIYTHVDIEDLRKAQKRYHPREQEDAE